MAPDPKVLNALRAMKDLGIPAETVKPVLKNLLKLYDMNWDLIEEDNYRTLADAIFECADDKRREDKKKDAMEYEGSEPPLKKIHLEQQEDQVSSTRDDMSYMLDLENSETPPLIPKQIKSSQLCLEGKKTESSSHSLLEAFNNKGKDPISSHFVVKAMKSSSERASSTSQSNQGKNGAGFDNMPRQNKHNDCRGETIVVPKRKQSVNDMPHLVLPTSMAHSALPGTLNGSSTGNNFVKYLASPCVDKDNRDNASAFNSGTTFVSNFVIASSPCGEVKIFLNCNSALRQPNFLPPNLDNVMEFVESKYLRSYNIVGSQFSAMKLLKYLCESYLELGYDSNQRSFIRRSSSGNRPPYITGHSREDLGVSYSGKDLIKKEASCSQSSNSPSLVVAQQQSTSPDKKKSFRKINDISKGTEKVRISLLDKIGTEQLPNFVYIPENTVYQNAYIHFSLARIADDDCCSSCLGNCLSLTVPCECARDTGGVFAYTTQGLLREDFLKNCISMHEEPQNHFHFYCNDCPLERAKNGNRPERCKGHLVRKFIKECWRKCGCDMQCGNRVVQRGITCKLQVFFTKEGKGWGVRPLQDLPKGSFVCEYVGEVLTNMELFERNKKSNGSERHTYPVLLDADWGSEGVLKDEDALCLDATSYGNVARFINHRWDFFTSILLCHYLFRYS
ncbi:hypothetical protein U1Q18_048288 [Sarracenia purpurea var. burkii]